MALKLQTKDLYDIIEKRHQDWPDGLDKDLQLWAYNGCDSAVTLMVHHSLLDTINRRNDPFAATSYRFVRAMQGPAMAMMLRGVMIQQRVRQDETARCQEQRARAQALLDRLCDAVWGPEEYTQVIKSKEWVTPIGKRGQLLKPRLVSKKVEIPSTRPRGLNPASSQQVLAFFNGALNFPVEYEIRKTATGNERTPTANDNTLRKWAGRRMKGPGINVRDPSVIPVKLAQPFVSLILTLRDLDKQLMILRTPLEPNGRMTCSYNVAGPETGRWSSSKNAYGRGTNLQNVTNTMRRMFCADDGWYLVSPDLEQAESYITAGCVWMATGDRTYLDAIKSGDLHTRVCMMAWPELGWQGTDPKHPFNRAIADRRYPDLGGLTYRDVAKRIGHGSNYGGTPYGIAAAVGIPHWIVEEFQARYFNAFRAIRKWHEWVKGQILAYQSLTTPLLRQRIFFNRPNDPKTVREAIAYVPQSTVAELLNLILYRVWYRSTLPHSHPDRLRLQVLLQNHDAFLAQIPDHPATIAPTINAINVEFQNAVVPFQRGDELLDLVIPGEFTTGWNWSHEDPKHVDFEDGNPDGLRKWDGGERRKRRQAAAVSPAEWLSGPLPNVY